MKRKVKLRAVHYFVKDSRVIQTVPGEDRGAEFSRLVFARQQERFLWYLLPPFNDKNAPYRFEHDHWWLANPGLLTKDKDQSCVLYELLRRHPTVGSYMLKRLKTRGDCELIAHPVAFDLQRFGRQSWPNLPEECREAFRSRLQDHYPGKGRDYRKLVVNVTEQARSDSGSDEGFDFDDALMEAAAEHGRDRRLILAIVTDFPSEAAFKSALKEIENAVVASRGRPGWPKRTHADDWLKTIVDFEKDFAATPGSHYKFGSKPFKRFKAMFEGVGFGPCDRVTAA